MHRVFICQGVLRRAKSEEKKRWIQPGKRSQGAQLTQKKRPGKGRFFSVLFADLSVEI